MLAIGGAAGAASFTHVHNLAAAHGQAGWLAWADAIVLELMSVASGLELRRRKRTRSGAGFPAVVLGCAVALSLSAQVVEAEPSPIGWIAAAVPALGFLVMVKVALGYTGVATRTSAVLSGGTRPDRTTPSAPVPGQVVRSIGPVGDRSAASTVRRSGAGHQLRRPDRGRSTPNRGRSTHGSADADELLSAARRVRDQAAANGNALTRSALAEALRAAGHTVSNTRLSELLKTVKAEPPSAPAPQHDDPLPLGASPAGSPHLSLPPAVDTAVPADERPAPPTSPDMTTTLDPTSRVDIPQEKPDHEHPPEPD